jgi:hypothetical protein
MPPISSRRLRTSRILFKLRRPRLASVLIGGSRESLLVSEAPVPKAPAPTVPPGTYQGVE